MGESVNLVHQKGDPYRTKGVDLTYCHGVVFQAFAELQKQPPFGPKSAFAAALLSVPPKSRAAAV
jgi:hypothetical protein